MQLVCFGTDAGREIERFGSVGALVAPLVRGDAQVVVLQLAAGGRLGRHPAVVEQVLAAVAGSGTVRGSDGVAHPVAPGDAAVWEPGEEHETRTDSGLTAIIVEGDGLEVVARP